jgi:hypothetical protein
MKTWEAFTMNRKEVPRAGPLEAALAGRISNAQGTPSMQTERQVSVAEVSLAGRHCRTYNVCT